MMLACGWMMCGWGLAMATPAYGQMYGGRPAAEWEPLEGGLQRFSVEVRPGMSIETIAYRYKVTPDAIRQWNTLEPGAAAEVGRHVLLHVPPEALPPEHRRLTHIVVPGDSWMSIAHQYGVRLGDLVSWNWRMDVDDLHHGDALFIYQPPGGEGLINRPLTLNHQLTSGPGFVVRNPHRSWGSQTMVALLRETLTATHTDFPERSPIQVGDISHRGGGFFPPHISHRNGRDADVGYYILNDPSTARRMVAATPETIDAERVWSLFKRLIHSGQLRGILVDVALQKVIYEEAQRQGESEAELRRIFQYPHRGPALITHWPGHDDHFHLMVR